MRCVPKTAGVGAAASSTRAGRRSSLLEVPEWSFHELPTYDPQIIESTDAYPGLTIRDLCHFRVASSPTGTSLRNSHRLSRHTHLQPVASGGGGC